MGLAAGTGGGYAAAALLPELAFLRLEAAQLCAATVMLLIAFGIQRRTLRLGGLFLALTFCLGGVVFLMTQIMGTQVLLLPSGAYYPVSMTGVLMMACGGYLVVYLFFVRIAEHGGGEIQTLQVSLNARTVQIRALRDTGNTLRDPITNERVLVAEWETAKRLLPDAALDARRITQPDILLPELAARYPTLHFRLIPYRAVGTAAGLLLAVRCMAADASGRKRRLLMAFSPTAVSDGGNFNALAGGML